MEARRMILIFARWYNQYNNTHSEAQNNVILFPCNCTGAARDIKLTVMPMRRYNMFRSTRCLRNNIHEAIKLNAPISAVKSPLYSPDPIVPRKYNPTVKYKAVLARTMLKSDAMNCLFSFMLLAILIAKNKT